jgi:hypothetical protein
MDLDQAGAENLIAGRGGKIIFLKADVTSEDSGCVPGVRHR